MLWATGAQLHCTLMGISQKAHGRFPLEGYEAAAFIHQFCSPLAEGGLGQGEHLLPDPFSIGKASCWLELELSAQGESELP